MASIINAATSGGLISTADTSGILQLQTAGTTAVTVNASQNVTFAGVTTLQAGTAALPALTTSGDTNTGIFFPAADAIAASTGGSERVRINSSGYVGIGVTAPTAQLMLDGNSQTAAQTFDYSVRGATFNNYYLASDSYNAYFDIAVTANDQKSIIRFLTQSAANTNPAERARFTSGGDFVIGATSSTGGKFEVTQSANSTVTYINSTNASQTNSIMFVSASRNTTNNTFYYLDCYNAGGGTYKLRIADSGNVTNTNNSYGAISDAKLKENIVDASPKLANLMQVKVRNYNLIGDTNKQLGVVAQELETVFPAMVDVSPDKDSEGNDLGTTTKSVKYSVFVPMLIKAIQEQQALITQLQADVAALKGA